MTEKPTPGPGPASGAPAAGPADDPKSAERPEEAQVHPVERPHLPAGRIPLGRLMLEAMMIAFGVLLALSLESWHEHRKQQTLAHEALDNIHTELTRNAQRIEGSLPKQRLVAEALQAFADSLEAGGEPQVPRLALHPPLLSTAAWNTAMSTQALAHMEFRTVQGFASFYEMLRWLDRLEEAWLRVIMEPRGNTLEERQQWAGSMVNTMLAYIEIENALLAGSKELVATTTEK
jgi:hypothetical protein